jgi:hypothetical protein
MAGLGNLRIILGWKPPDRADDPRRGRLAGKRPDLCLAAVVEQLDTEHLLQLAPQRRGQRLGSSNPLLGGGSEPRAAVARIGQHAASEG